MKIKTKINSYLISLSILPMLLTVNILDRNLLTLPSETPQEKNYQNNLIQESSLFADSYYSYHESNFQVNFGDKNTGQENLITFTATPANNQSGNNQSLENKDISFSFSPNDRITPSTPWNNFWQYLSHLFSFQTSSQIINIHNDQAIITDIAPDTDLRYTILPNRGLKEELIIKGSQDVKDKYFFNLQLENGVKIIKNDSEKNQHNIPVNSYYFTDNNDNYLAHFLPISISDSNGSTTDKATLDISPITSNQYQIMLSIDPLWLFSPARQYPIIIDPTIVHDSFEEFNAGDVMNRLEAISGPKIQLANQESATDISTIGLWHMNETSGSTVTDFSGNSNNGTATGTTIVDGKINKARSFNGTSDYISIPISGKSSLNKFSIELWIKTSESGSNGTFWNRPSIIGESTNNASSGDFGITTNSGYLGMWSGLNSSGDNSVISSYLINDNQWHHIAAVNNGSFVQLYLDGKDTGSTLSSGLNLDSYDFYIGAQHYYTGGAAFYHQGIIDDVRITNTYLTPEEIKTDAQLRPYGNYTSDVIDLNSNSPTFNSISWIESGAKTGNGETPYSTDGLVAQWNFNETSGTTANNNAGSCGSSCNGTLTNMTTTGQDASTNSGWTANNKKWGNGALMFDGSDDYIQGNNNIDISGNPTFTIESWFKPIALSDASIIGFGDSNTSLAASSMFIGSNGSLLLAIAGGNNASTTNGLIKTGNWYHAVIVKTPGPINSTTKIYINGIDYSVSGSTSTPNITNLPAVIGRFPNYNGYYFNGVIDASRIYNRALSADEILSNYQAGNIQLQTRTGADNTPDDNDWEEWRPSGNNPANTETQILSLDNDQSNWTTDEMDKTYIAKSNDDFIKQEGNSSLKTKIGQSQTDANTLALWHLDETGGSGSYIKDATGNDYHFTPTGTTTSNGINNKGRYFDGSGDYLSTASNANLYLGNTWTIDTWLKPSYYHSPYNMIFSWTPGSWLQVYLNGSGQVGISTSNQSEQTWTEQSLPLNTWSHVAISSNTGSTTVYVNGVALSTKTTTFASGTNGIKIGWDLMSGREYTGLMDEYRITKGAYLTANEIAETYRMGRDHRLNRTISSTDLSEKSLLPFYVAADKPGTYLETTIGESAFANNLSDSNTVGLWHLEEASSSGAYIKDSSSYGNNGTPTNTTFINGKIGKGRNFNGSSDKINFSTNGFSTITTYSVSLWVKPSSSASGVMLWEGSNISAPSLEGWTTDLYFYVGNSAYINTGTLTIGQWYQIVATYDKATTTQKLYVNGKLIGSNNVNVSDTFGSTFYLATRAGSSMYYPGTIDEVRIDNIARTADEIRQAYEIGTRTHQITIDFASSLDSGNLITDSSDTSFTIDATTKGLSQKGDKLFVGDKIIVRENYDGTEYIAQGTVNSIDASTGAVTINSWETGSTFPSSGFTINADTFKWQQEYFDISASSPSQRDTITNLTYRITDGSAGKTIWIDDLKSVSNYLTNPTGSSINSTPNRYFQYRILPTTTDKLVTPSVNSVSINYSVSSTQEEFGLSDNLNRVESLTGPQVQLKTMANSSNLSTVGLWHLDEISGSTITDSSGNGNTGTATGTTIIDGKIKKARSFNGSSDYIGLGDSFDNITSGADKKFSIEAWIKPNASMTNNVIITKLGDSGCSENQRQYNLGLATGSKLQFGWATLSNSSYRYVIGSTSITDTNKWYHVTMVYDGSIDTNNGLDRVSLYIDGSKESTSISYTSGTLSDIENGTAHLGIGSTLNSSGGVCGTGYKFNGLIDEVKITSNTLTSEEVKAQAQLRPYGVYTSEVLNLNSDQPNLNTISWNEHGVKTGDDETDLTTNGLIAQWNFNETSSATAYNNAGTCGSSCNGTLTNTTITGQDADPLSGWTATNKKLGTGALMFDGTNDYVDIGKSSTVKNQSQVTISAWVKINSIANYHTIYYESNNTTAYTRFNFTVETDRSVRLGGRDTDGTPTFITFAQTSPASIEIGKWYYLVGIFDADTDQHKIYINAKDQTITRNNANTFPNTDPVDNIRLGATTSNYSNATFDKISLYFRTLSDDEILSNYQSGNIQLQTRTGTTSTPDNTWEEWRPSGSNPANTETSIDNFDNINEPNSISGLAMWLKADAISGLSDNDPVTSWNDSSGNSRNTSQSNSNYKPIYKTNILNGQPVIRFDGTDDVLPIFDSNPQTMTSVSMFIVHQINSGATSASYYPLILGGEGNTTGKYIGFETQNSSSGSSSDIVDVFAGFGNDARSTLKDQAAFGSWKLWSTVSQNTIFNTKMYVNGTPATISSTGTNQNLSVKISTTAGDNWGGIGGTQYSLSPVFYKGDIAEILIYNRSLSDRERNTVEQYLANKYNLNISNQPTLCKNEGNIKQEGSNSQKTTIGQTLADANTMGLWHLDETGGSGAFIKDSSGNSNNGTPSGTTTSSSIISRSRSFNGSGDYINTGNTTSQNITGEITVEAWINPNTVSIAQQSITSRGGGWGRAGWLLTLNNNVLRWHLGNGGGEAYFDSATTISANQWTHVAATWTTGGVMNIYVNGIKDSNSTTWGSGAVSNSYDHFIGRTDGGATFYFNGKIDEVSISNISRTADEIAETYRMGRDHRLNRTISSTDLSEKSLIPFYVAADKPGTYLETTIGESAFTNNLPDSNTVGLWRLEEATGSGSGAYLKDSSGYANNGTPTGTTVINGKIGKTRNFSGSTQYITIPDSVSLKPTSTITISSWFNTNNKTTDQRILSKTEGGSYQLSLNGGSCPSNTLCFLTNISGTYRYASYPISNISNNTWYHVVGLYDGTKIQLYLNGNLVSSASYTGALTNSTAPLCIGSEATSSACSGGTYFNGIIDEIRIDNIARTADEIRQAYEIGLRTHPITIDFAASLNSENLISNSSDTQFRIDATTRGLPTKTENIFVGDKIIIRENYDGTEYIAQGTVSNINTNTGAIEVSTWDTGSTFPSIGYSVNADVFKWQREYFDISASSLSQRDAITNITTRITDGSEGRTIWFDDLKSVTNYFTDPIGNDINSTPHRYFQYRIIPTTTDTTNTPYITDITMDYETYSIRIDGGSTDQIVLNNNNKSNFPISVYGIETITDQTVTAQASWNQSNWYDLDFTVGPVSDLTLSASPDITTWTDYPATDGVKTIYVRASLPTVQSLVRSFNVTKDTTAPTIENITSVTGDNTSPYNDASDNNNTLIIYTPSSDSVTCKWEETDMSYAGMSHYCESLSNCTLNLSGTGEKNIYFRCLDSHDNTSDTGYHLTYTIGGISMETASTTAPYINNHNKNSFPLSANNVIYEASSSTVTTQGSWNQTDWYDITTVASPISNSTITGNSDITTWTDYPTSEGTVTLYIRAKGGSSDYSNPKSFDVLKDTLEASISGFTSVASDPNPPYIDPTNNQNTLVLYTTSSDTTACKWDISDSINYDAMSHICESTTNCTINLEGRGSHTVYFRCLDIHGNKQASYTPLTYTINTASSQPFGWQQTRTIGINPPTATNDYQVRVELTPNTFDYDNAKDDGSDIKFYDLADNKLNYWIEDWNNRGTSIIWVKVPTIGTDKLNMFYGNYSGTSESNYDETFNKGANSVGLVGWWHLDDNINSTTAIDSSGSNNLANLTNGPTWQSTDGGGWADQSDTHFTEGHHLSFDGNNDYLEIAHSSSIDPQTEWTLETWVNRDYISSQHSLIEKYPNIAGQGGYIMRIGADNKLYGYIMNGTSSQNCVGATNILDSSWYHVAVTYDSVNNQLSCYVNGELDGYNNSVTYDYMTSSNSSLKIGARGNDTGTPLNGKLDEVRIYNRALSGQEIRAQFERRKYHANGPVTTLGGTQLYSEDYNSQTDWLDANWTNRTTLTIFNNGNSQSMTDYQTVFNLDTKYLSDQNKLQANTADLRFTTADGQTALPYFVQAGTNEINTKIFIKLPAIGANSQQKIFVYYNNPSAVSNSSESIMEFYDDFEDNTISDTKWPTKSLGTHISETGGQIQMTGIQAGNYYLQSPAISSANINLIIESQTYSPTLPTNGWSPISWWKSTSSGLSILEHPNTLIGQQNSWHNGLFETAQPGKNISETHLNQLILKNNYNTTVQSKFSNSYFSNWSADYFDNSQDNYYIRLGARPDNYDPGSIQTMDGRIDWVLARKYTSIEPRVGAYKVAYVTKKGNIDSETWSGTIYIEEPVILNPGQTLTIEPGTIIKFNTDSYLLAENSNISAIGLPYDYIYFTSVNNDSMGTIMDNSTGNPGAGDWQGVYVISSGNSIFKFCDFGYGGKSNTINSTNFLGMLNAKENDFTVVNTIFNNSQNADIFGFQASPYIYRNNLGDSPYGIYLDANNQVVTNPIEYNSFANTTISALYIDNLPDTDNDSGPGLILRNNDIDETNTGFYIQNPSGSSIRDNNAENTVDATHNSFKNQSGYMCHYDTAGGNCKFDRTDGGAILFDTNSIILTAPNGNEQWMAGTNHNVTWNINNGMLTGSYVDVYLSPNSGEEFDFTIATNLTCDGSGSGPGCSTGLGSYNWLVTGVPNNEKRLKAVLRNSSGESLAEDISDHNFQINLITDELTNPAPGEESIHNLKFAVPYFWGNQVNGSVQVTLPDEFDFSLSATDVAASGGGVTWNSPNIIGDHTITFPFTGTLNSSGGLATLTMGGLNSNILNPLTSGTYPVTVTIHNSADGTGPAIRRLGTYINIHNDIGFSFHIAPALQLSIRDASDTQEINRLSFINPSIDTPNDVSHIIKTSTNSHHGYSITVQQLSDMTGPNSAIINAFTATNENPSSWTSPPGGSITGYHGYHTSDNSLGYGTTNRFNNANTWAGLTGTAQEIAYTPNSIQDDITTMTYRLQFTSKQPAGHYEHTVLYIITPNY